MTSWRRLTAGSVGLFLIVLAFLAGQLRAGADPALRRSAARTQSQTQTRPQPRTAPTQPDPGTGQGGYGYGNGGDNGTLPYDDGSDPYSAPGDGSSGDAAPGSGSSGDAAPGGTLPDAAPPTTHQS